MKLLGFALISLALGATSAFAHGPRVPRDLKNVHRIVCMGDSITQMGDSEGGHGYVRLIRLKLQGLFPDHGFEVINVGIGGQKAPDMLARWQRDVLDKHPDLVTLSVGINDVWHGFYGHPAGDGPNGVPIDLYRQDVTQMIESALAAHIQVVLVSPTVIQENADSAENVKLQGYVDAEREIAKRHHIKFIDLHATFLDELSKLRTGKYDKVRHLTTDGVHMKPAGDALMASTILTSLGINNRDLGEIAH